MSGIIGIQLRSVEHIKNTHSHISIFLLENLKNHIYVTYFNM